MKIDTQYVYIIDAWLAWADPEGPRGEGKTEQAAIADLQEQLEDIEAER